MAKKFSEITFQKFCNQEARQLKEVEVSNLYYIKYLKGRNFGRYLIWQSTNFDILIKIGGKLIWWFKIFPKFNRN